MGADSGAVRRVRGRRGRGRRGRGRHPGDGSLAAWGRNDYGEATIPAGLGLVVRVDVGNQHVLAVRADGTVAGWGMNDQGQATVPAELAGE